MPQTYEEKILFLSYRIIETQKSIRILESIKWDESVEQQLKKSNFKEMPLITPAYYLEKNDLGFKPEKKKEEFDYIQKEIHEHLGEQDEIGKILIEICQNYQDAIALIEARGTQKFGILSKKLYGSTQDLFYSDSFKLADLASTLAKTIPSFPDSLEPEERIPAHQAVEILEKKIQSYFQHHLASVKLSEEITSDAAAGGDVIKLKEGHNFTLQELEQLEVHEGWVHIGTTQNGLHQKSAKWLSRCPPRGIATQEGLAFFMEILSGKATTKRIHNILNRVLAIEKAEKGANLLDIIEFFRLEGYTEHECLQSARRVFRGGIVTGGTPFTKDISYLKGLLEICHFIQTAIQLNKTYLIPFLFVGKMKLSDMPSLYQKYLEGIITSPQYLPPQFSNIEDMHNWLKLFPFESLKLTPQASEYFKNILNNI